jgi:hypothetical protein
MKMTTDDKEFLKDFLSGVMLGVGTLGVVGLLAIILNGAANWLDAQPTPSNQRFEVVDEYKGCDVVRYNPDGSARYSYMLYCGEQK